MTKLQVFALVNESLDIMQEGTRNQVSTDSLDDVLHILERILLDKELEKGLAYASLGSLYTSLQEVKKTTLRVLSNDMKEFVVSVLQDAKEEYAIKLISDFRINDYEFEEGDTTFNLLREAVALTI